MTWTCLSWGLPISGRLPRWYSNKEPACQSRRRRLDPWDGKIPWRRRWQPTPVLLPGKPNGQRSLEGYRPRGRKESAVTDGLSTDIISGNTSFTPPVLKTKAMGTPLTLPSSSNSASLLSIRLSTPHVSLHWCSGQIPQPPLPASHRNLKQAPSFHPHTLRPTMNKGARLGLLKYTAQGLHVAPGLGHNSSSRRPSKSGLLLAALLICPLLLGLWLHWPPSVPQADQAAPPWRLALALSCVQSLLSSGLLAPPSPADLSSGANPAFTEPQLHLSCS